tara:strand:- start:7248 stop:7481 length:234 start_codon:yes stop_codon:yes gene_type:complete
MSKNLLQRKIQSVLIYHNYTLCDLAECMNVSKQSLNNQLKSNMSIDKAALLVDSFEKLTGVTLSFDEIRTASAKEEE